MPKTVYEDSVASQVSHRTMLLSCQGYRPSWIPVLINEEAFIGDHSPRSDAASTRYVVRRPQLKDTFHAFPQDFRTATTLLLPF